MSKPKILIAEDEAVIALDIKSRLISFGYDIVGIARTADECIKLASREKPDIVLMDIFLKGETTGITAAEILKRDYNLRVVFLTAHTDDATIEKAKLAEPLGFIVKPFELQDIKTTLEISLYKAKMEMKLSESELKYRTLVLTATDAVLTLDVDGFITSINNKAFEMFGFPEEDIVGKSIKTILPDVFINHLQSGITRFLNVGKSITPDTIELLAKKKDGRNFPAEISFSQWQNTTGVQFTLIVRDITRRKESEETIKKYQLELEKRVEERTVELTELINQLPIGINLYNMKGEVVYKNRVAAKIWNQSVSELEQHNYTVFSDEIFARYGYSESIKTLFSEGISFKTKPLYFDSEELFSSDDENGRLFIFHFFGVINESGEIFRVVSLIEDITDRAKAEEANIALKERKHSTALIFQRLEEERIRISRELHDGLGQILSAIKMNIEAYERGDVDDYKPLFTAKNLIGDANTEIKNILYSLRPTFLEKYGLVTAIKSLCDSSTEATGIKFKFIRHGELYRLKSDFELTVFRIVQEAVNNIIKHSKTKSAEVVVSLNNENINIIIKDFGVGFKFSDSNDLINLKSYGLVSMRERIEILNGSLNIDTELDKGTEISIIIPISGSI